jgi:hypothetical protein
MVEERYDGGLSRSANLLGAVGSLCVSPTAMVIARLPGDDLDGDLKQKRGYR